jgi:hypothetical protein
MCRPGAGGCGSEDLRRANPQALRYSDCVTKRPHENIELIKRALGNDYLTLSMQRFVLEEDASTGTSKVRLECVDQGGASQLVEGEGCGMVDALFTGLLGRYAVEYQSLESLELASFKVQARLETKKDHSGVDALGLVTFEVRNSEGHMFSFSDESRSIATSTARALLAVVEYFVNSERAFITLFKSFKDAQQRNRADLVTRYTEELAEVVKSTSYAEVLEKMKRELK